MHSSRKPVKIAETLLAGRVHRKKLREGVKSKLGRDPGVPRHELDEYKARMNEKLDKQKRREAAQRADQSNKRANLAQLKRDQQKAKLDGMAAAILAGAAAAGGAVPAAAAAGAGAGAAGGPADKELQLNNTDVTKRKWFYAEMRRVVEAADVILEVLDARDPAGCRCSEAEEMIRQAKTNVDGSNNKRLILILNKIDLVPPEVVQKWVKYLRREYPTIAFKSSTQQQRAHLGHSKLKAPGAGSGTKLPGATSGQAAAAAVQQLDRNTCVGAGALLQLLKNYSRSADMKKIISVGIIGYPNVGKSSLINSLKRSRAVGVSSTPGFTKSVQQVKLDAHINLLDSPGVLFADGAEDADLVLRNCLKVEQITDPVTVAYKIVSKCTMPQLQAVYGIGPFRSGDDFLLLVARKRGKLGKGGVPNMVDAARTVIQDWNENRIAFYSLPPEPAQSAVNAAHETIALVGAWSKEFKFDQLLDEVKDIDDDDDAAGAPEDGMNDTPTPAAAPAAATASSAAASSAGAAAKFSLVMARPSQSAMNDDADKLASAMMNTNTLAEIARMEQQHMAKGAAAGGARAFAYAPAAVAPAAAAAAAAVAAAAASGAPLPIGLGATSVPAPLSGVLLPAHALEAGKVVGNVRGDAVTAAAAGAAGAGMSDDAFGVQQLLATDNRRSNRQNTGAAMPVSEILASEGIVRRNKELKAKQKREQRDRRAAAKAEADERAAAGPAAGSAGPFRAAAMFGGAAGGGAAAALASLGLRPGAAAAPAGSGRTIQQALMEEDL